MKGLFIQPPAIEKDRNTVCGIFVPVASICAIAMSSSSLVSTSA